MDFTTPGYHSPTYSHKTGDIPLVGNFSNPEEAQLNVANVDTEVEPPKKEQYTFITETPLNTLINMLRQRETFTLSSLSRHGIYNVIKFLSVDNCTSIFGLNLGKLGSVLDAIDSDDIDYSALYKIQFDIVQTTKDDKSMQLYTASVWLWDNDQNEYKPMKIIITLN